jgi:hypothetical protein
MVGEARQRWWRAALDGDQSSQSVHAKDEATLHEVGRSRVGGAEEDGLAGWLCRWPGRIVMVHGSADTELALASPVPKSNS